MSILFSLLAAGAAAAESVETLARAALAEAGFGETSGYVVGVIEPDGSVATWSAGGDGLDADTMFEIGSFSKVFTGVLLARLADAGEVALDDPVTRHLPNELEYDRDYFGRIELWHLATHTAGLPRLPPNMGLLWTIRHASDPYAAYGTDELYEGIAETDPAPVGRVSDYSNYGTGLLGHALERATGRSYAALVREYIVEPLGLATTWSDGEPAPAGRMAAPHKGNGKPAGPWHYASLHAAGAVRSSVNDMLAFLRAAIDPPPGALGAAMSAALEPRFEDAPERATGLGWVLNRASGATVAWHNGQTGGYSSFAGFVDVNGAAIVVLSNRAQAEALTGAGLETLKQAIELPPAVQSCVREVPVCAPE
jgi:CubicO group peptidase (beta-lactamase class C family)